MNEMNANNRRVPTEFGPETRFELDPVPAGPFRAVQDNRFEPLKNRLLREQLEEVWEVELNSQVRRAANEAAALAWLTPYPSLVFPVLFEEKTQAAFVRFDRQGQIRQRSRELLAI